MGQGDEEEEDERTGRRDDEEDGVGGRRRGGGWMDGPRQWRQGWSGRATTTMRMDGRAEATTTRQMNGRWTGRGDSNDEDRRMQEPGDKGRRRHRSAGRAGRGLERQRGETQH